MRARAARACVRRARALPARRATAARRGVALLAVLAALALVALLLLAVAADVQRAQRAVRRDVGAHAALAAAERALYGALAAWPARAPLALARGQALVWDAPPLPSPAGAARAALRVTRLAPSVLRLDASATVGDRARGGVAARRATSLLVALEPARLAARGALVVLGAAAADATTIVDGRDTLLVDDADCLADSGAAPGVRRGPGAELALDGAAVGGAPPLLVDSSLAAGTLAPVTGDTALPRASPVLAHDGTLGGPVLRPRLDDDARCAPTDAGGGNWGDPHGPTACADYHPVLHVRGDLVAPAGAGQGTLVVDGDLELRGALAFHGVVLVRGQLRVLAPGDRIVGTLLLAAAARSPDGVPAPPHRLHGLHVRWSACAVRRALRAAGAVRPVSGAAWRPGW